MSEEDQVLLHCFQELRRDVNGAHAQIVRVPFNHDEAFILQGPQDPADRRFGKATAAIEILKRAGTCAAFQEPD